VKGKAAGGRKTFKHNASITLSGGDGGYDIFNSE